MELFSARARRRFSRGLKRKPMALIKRLRKAKKEAPPLKKPEVCRFKTNTRMNISIEHESKCAYNTVCYLWSTIEFSVGREDPLARHDYRSRDDWIHCWSLQWQNFQPSRNQGKRQLSLEVINYERQWKLLVMMTIFSPAYRYMLKNIANQANTNLTQATMVYFTNVSSHMRTVLNCCARYISAGNDRTLPGRIFHPPTNQ